MINLPILAKKKENNKDKYQLTTSVKLCDVKGYLQNEYDRANERESNIKELENQIEDLKKIELKYQAMLVIQEETTKRTRRQDEDIKDLKEKIKSKTEEIKVLNSKQIDIKINAEKKLKSKDEEIKMLKETIKKLEKELKNNSTVKKTKSVKNKN